MSTRAQAAGLATLRATNRNLVTDALRQRDEVSRAELARLTGLSGTTVSTLVAELTTAGVIEEVEPDPADRVARGSGRTGRPGRLLRLRRQPGLVAAVELGHDSALVALADLTGRVLADRRVERDVDQEGAAALTATAALIRELLAEAAVDRRTVQQLVLGVSGIVDPTTGQVLSDRMPAWRGVDPAGVLAAATGWSTVVENDADLAALGEHSFGAAAGLRDVVYLEISAGIGAGLVLDGRLYRGHQGGAGEIGHVQIQEHGVLCPCGNRGCLETVASVPAALAVIRTMHPHARSAADLAALVSSGDRAALRVVVDAGRAIGKAVADLCNALAPQAVVVGGAMADVGAPFVDAIASAVNRYTPPRIAAGISVLPGSLGARAAVLGAVALARQGSGGG